MPINQMGVVQVGGNLDEKLRGRIDDILSRIDKEVAALSRAKNLFPSQVRLLQPLHCCVLVVDADVLVVLAVHDVGGIAIKQYMDFTGKDINLAGAIYLAERDLSFKSAFGFSFKRDLVDLDEDRKTVAIAQIAQNLILEEIVILERERRVVRIDPIFQGREFLLNEELVFVLSPFADPFNTIYEDHIKPCVESTQRLKCLRADDIFDNRPIIEDIWRYTNEARLLISELTERNPNVFYETGIAHTIGKEVILITQSMDDVPFDLKHLRCIVYEYTPKGIRNLEDNLRSTIGNIMSR